MRMNKFWKISLLFLGCFLSVKAESSDREVPVPTQAQVVWQDAELVAVFHYDLHVFDTAKYVQTQNRITPISDVNIFNPEKLDTDQWIKAAREMGAKIAILTATHETGFALYQSDVNPYCLKAVRWRDGKGDIVRDFVRSCRKYGVLPGVYIGIRWNSFLGVHDFLMPQDGTDFQRNRQEFYNRMCEGMTRELMSRYGDLAIVWYDGGSHGPELGGPDILPVVEKYQKNIIFYHNTQRADIRWGGSETGTVPYPCWGTYPFPYSHAKNQNCIFKDNNRLLKTGDPEGKHYMPAMSDTPLRGYNGRHEWFWEPGDEAHIYPLEDLQRMYEQSVGHNSTLIIGLTPDNRGLLPDADVRRIREFGQWIKETYGMPLKAVSGKSDTLEMAFDEAQQITRIVLQEDIRQGERVRAYEIEGLTSDGWKVLASGTCIGHKRIERFDPVSLHALRLKVLDSEKTPLIRTFAAYR